MRNRSALLTVAMLLAAPLLGLVAPGAANAAPASTSGAVASVADSSKAPAIAGWIYWATYPTAASCIATGSTLAYAGSPIYAAYYCEEEYSTIGNYFSYELFLYKKF